MRTDFKTFLSQLHETNQTLDFFCDFDKISKNVDNIKLSLCMLNSLIGSSDLRKSVETLWLRDSSAFKVLGILIATRDAKKKTILDNKRNNVKLIEYFSSVDKIMEFLTSTGLEKIFLERKVENLVDYVFGVETGLDTHARKNRGGTLMQNTVASIFTEHKIIFEQEVYSSRWPEMVKVLGVDDKRFDFVFKRRDTTYLVEVNFYNSDGSKLNEIARSFSEVGSKIDSVPGFEFIWITDGYGWRNAKNGIDEAYRNLPHIYNLTNIHDFLESI